MTVFLEQSYRTWLFCRLYIESGESLGEMARLLGYAGKGRNGTIRQMWLGRLGIPEAKLDKICNIVTISKTDVLNHAIDKKQSELIKDWVQAVILFKKFKNPQPNIFTN